MRVELFGPVRAWRGDREVTVGPPRRRAVLAALALGANRVVSRDEIVDAVWGDMPPPSAANGVHVHVGALRQTLASGGELESSRSGYLLRLAPELLDVAVFTERLTAAQRLFGAGEAAAAVDAYDAALVLWHGTPLVGVAGPLADAQRLRLGELRLTALEDRAEALLDLQSPTELVAELTVLAGEFPLRERLRAALMLALHRSGRRAEALRLYADTRRLLVEELGVEPGSELQRLHQSILTAAVDKPRDAGPDTPVPRQLPPAARHFAGRHEHLRELTGLLDDAGEGGPAVLSAIGGTAGVGKSALAVYWAHRVANRFPDGQLYVNLRGFDQTGSGLGPAAAVRGFLDALGVPSERVPPDLAAQAGLYRSLLAGRRVLIVLDNARDADQVRPLLPGVPGCFVVVTSRNRLTGLIAADGAHPVTLDLLSTAEAHDLLARRLGPQRVAAEPEAVDEIVTRCARLPLALTLVAARAASHPTFPLATLAGELSDTRGSLDAFTDSDPASDVRAVFSWSYRALGPAAARLFRLFGTHPGTDISAAAAACLAGVTSAGVRPPLAELTHAHLLTEHVPGRYSLHDLLYAYATEIGGTVDPPADRHAALCRLLDHYTQTAQAAAVRLSTSPDTAAPEHPEIRDAAHALAWFTAEQRVLLTAIEVADRAGLDTHVWRLALAVGVFLDLRGDWDELIAIQLAALAAAQRLADWSAQARVHRLLGRAHGRAGRYGEAHPHFRRALDLYGDLGDHTALARTHQNTAWVLEKQGRLTEALEHAERALALHHAAGSRSDYAVALNDVSWCYAQLGQFDRASVHCGLALTVHREVGNQYGEAATLDTIGYIHRQLGRHADAVACLREGADLYRAVGDRWNEADVLRHLGDAHDAAGDPGAARAAWRNALAIFEELRHPDADGVRARLDRLAPVAGG
jgi:DNA-binding SARP family transcriptional activator/tetratricopeptide (TPR) repeat protein